MTINIKVEHLTSAEQSALLHLVAYQKTEKQKVLTAFEEGVKFALTGKLPIQKQPVLFQPPKGV